ncbi:MAG TPA: alanine racemase [bacterium]|nr:alanine racemase [bacterium]HOL47005.1 alanine racemase [bacterium]HPQ18999.1 alanine racemase [bacterium]
MKYYNDLMWVEISKSNLINNIEELKKNLPKNTIFSAVVKSNAYGHGMIEVSKIVTEYGINWLCVNSLAEALELKDNGIKANILILGYIQLSEIELAIKNNFRFTVYNIETIKQCEKILKANKEIVANIHLKLETGTNRQGILEKDLEKFIRYINKIPNLIIEGVSTHYANIEDTTDHSYAKMQLENFKRMSKYIEDNYKKENKILKHTACSAAVILFKETYFDMVRAGISLYGLWPSKETYLSTILLNKEPIKLKPVLSWKTKIAQIKTIPANSYISYGCTFKTVRKTKIAIIPVGYYDGYRRIFSNKSYVLVKNQRAKICGRVCMNMFIIDVTDIKNVKVEDEVILIGSCKNDSVSADTLAPLAETINYEIVTQINPYIKRVIVK